MVVISSECVGYLSLLRYKFRSANCGLVSGDREAASRGSCTLKEVSLEIRKSNEKKGCNH